MKPTWQSREGYVRIYLGDCIDTMKALAKQSIQTCVTSPPYYGLRDYGTATWEGGDSECDHFQPLGGGSDKQKSNKGSLAIGYGVVCAKCGARRIDAQLGLEATPDEYVANMVEVFRAVRRVLRDDGTVWLNLGDSYANSCPGSGGRSTKQDSNVGSHFDSVKIDLKKSNLKPKDLCGIPWRVALALQADGWYLRQDIIWHKPNPMPESVRDRCTKAHEYVFLLSKRARYYYNRELIRDAAKPRNAGVMRAPKCSDARIYGTQNQTEKIYDEIKGANRRSVWTVPTTPYKGAHFATFPPDLIRPCILAGCPKGGTVLDPFAGSGTTALVAIQNGRRAVLCELNPEYIKLSCQRLKKNERRGPLFLDLVK